MVTIEYDPNAHSPARASSGGRGAFKGQVSSYLSKCRIGRKVRLVREHHGVVRHTKTKGTAGRWEIFYPNAHGRFYARVLKKSFFAPSGRRVICTSDRSPTLVVKQ